MNLEQHRIGYRIAIAVVLNLALLAVPVIVYEFRHHSLFAGWHLLHELLYLV